MRRFLLLPVVLVAVAAAAPVEPPDDLIRRANAAFLAGDAAAAESLYAAAEERTGDPGLIAFNRAAMLFQQGDFHAAAVNYARVLDDAACPEERAARAWFNRGTCLIRLGGGITVYRTAIVCLDRCLTSPAADAPLQANARQNLELAKLLWLEANQKAAKPESPNDFPRDNDRPPPPATPPKAPENGSDPGSTGTPGKENRPAPAVGVAPKVGTDPAGNPIPGNAANPEPLLDDSTPQKLSPEDTREYLRRAEERLREERRQMLRTLYGPPRPGVRDW